MTFHRIVAGKIAEEWGESDFLSVMEPAFEQEIRMRERIEQELRIARLIQQTLLPKTLPQLSGYAWRLTSSSWKTVA
jgi:hypothetical protein